MLKLNLKLGGGNLRMAPQQGHGRGAGLALMQACPTMVCGLDVYHPPPGSSEPSWVALVAPPDHKPPPHLPPRTYHPRLPPTPTTHHPPPTTHHPPHPT